MPNTAIPVTSPPTFNAALTAASGQWPDAEALVFDDARLTYADLARLTDDTARSLLALGVRRGDHVAVCLGNGVEWVRLFYGIAAIGAVVVPINTRFKSGEIRYALEQSDARVLIVADRFLGIDFIGMLREICPSIDTAPPHAELPKLQHIVTVGDTVPAAAISFDEFLADAVTAEALAAAQTAVSTEDVALIQYTSGTTSFPKGAMLRHRNMLHNAAWMAARTGVRTDDRYYVGRPFFHVGGTTMGLLVALLGGACLITTTKFDPAETLRILSEERCTMTSGNDTMFQMLMGHPDFDKRTYHLRTGIAAVSPSVMRDLAGRFGAGHMVVAYGLSEASPNIAMSDCNDPLEDRIDGLARIHDGLEVRIVDDDGTDLPAGQDGEILTRGWTVMKGYYNMPEATAETIDTDGWLHTGDLGRLSDDNRLVFIGRKKEIIRVGGENLAPAEVEECINQHPAVSQAQVIGVPDPRLIEVPAAYVVPNDGADLGDDEVIAWCRERIANFKVPRYVKIIDGFERYGLTGSNKVRKASLVEHAAKDFDLG